MAIKIQCTDDAGNKYIINHFSSENAEVGNVAETKQLLINKAIGFIGEWIKVFPDCKFTIVDA